VGCSTGKKKCTKKRRLFKKSMMMSDTTLHRLRFLSLTLLVGYVTREWYDMLMLRLEKYRRNIGECLLENVLNAAH